MKQKVLTLFIIALGISASTITAQEQLAIDTINMDVMVAPNSPAFNLLGINPTLIDKPSTPTEFAFSIANASSNFAQLPKNYAVEFLPVPLFFSKSKAGHDLTTKKFANTLAQTFSISSAFTTNDTVSTTIPNYIKTRTGIGFKVSLLRGNIDTKDSSYIASLVAVRKKLDYLHKKLVSDYEADAATDVVYVLLKDKKAQIIKEIIRYKTASNAGTEQSQATIDSLMKADAVINQSIQTRVEEIKNISITKAEVEAKQLKAAIESIKFKRHGAMLDLAGAMAIGYRNDDFQNSIVQQYAFWFNGGYSTKKGFDFLALARYNNNVKALSDSLGQLSDETSFDIGGKIEFISKDNKFSIAGEAIARFVSDTSLYRYTFNTSYQVKKNQAITLSIGKNFGATKATFGGNLIATINYAIAFGSNRRIYE
jgi:hypothetical protein